METSSFGLDDYQTEDVMSVNHSQIMYNLGLSLATYRDEFSIMPELEFELSAGRAKPDIAVCLPIKIDWIRDTLRPTVPPLVAIEILSPKQAFTDITDKIYDTYFPSGVQSCWIIVPALKTVYVLSPDGKQTVFSSGEIITDTTTSIQISVDALFA